jgi:hypothetical protein
MVMLKVTGPVIWEVWLALFVIVIVGDGGGVTGLSTNVFLM